MDSTMSETTTEQGNRLIIESPFVSDIHKKWREKALEAGEEFYQEKLLPELKYHTSWDWLMPAFYKFRNLKLSVVDEGFNDHYSRHLEMVATAIVHYNIEKAFERFVKAIVWYNNQKQNP